MPRRKDAPARRVRAVVIQPVPDPDNLDAQLPTITTPIGGVVADATGRLWRRIKGSRWEPVEEEGER
jgi:hypothetical protein